MIVRELILLLQQADPAARVIVDDWYGNESWEVEGVRPGENGNVSIGCGERISPTDAELDD